MRAVHKEYIKERVFLKACKLANVEPTSRQASKFRRRKGVAFRYVKTAAREVSIEEKRAK